MSDTNPQPANLLLKPYRTVGIIGYGAYVPRYRLPASEVARVWTNGEGGLPIKEKAVAGLDEDVATMSIEASRNALNQAKTARAQLAARGQGPGAGTGGCVSPRIRQGCNTDQPGGLKELLPGSGQVFLGELFLQIDRVRGDDGFLLVRRRIQDRRQQVRQALAHPRAGLDGQVFALFQRAGDRHGHLLLLGPELEILRARQEALGREDLFDLFD